MAKYKDDSKRVIAAVRSEMAKRLSVCGVVGVNAAKILIGIEGTGSRWRDETITTWSGKQRIAKKGSLVYGFAPSEAGEPPHKQTGRLQSSVAWELDRSKMVVRVGTNVEYGRYLELGTRHIIARPWLRRMLRERGPVFYKVLTRPIKV